MDEATPILTGLERVQEVPDWAAQKGMWEGHDVLEPAWALAAVAAAEEAAAKGLLVAALAAPVEAGPVFAECVPILPTLALHALSMYL